MAEVITRIEQVTPAWLTHLLQEKGYLHQERITEIQEIQTSKTNMSQVHHLQVRYSNSESQAPRRLFLKIPNPDLTGDNKEIQFYNTIAPHMLDRYSDNNWPFLHCYDAVYSTETGGSHLLLEELSETHFTTAGPLPPSQKHSEQLIEAYAFFHAYWWEHPRLGQDIGQRLDEAAIDNFLITAQRKFGDFVDFMGERLTSPQQDILEGVVSAWPARRRDRVIQGKGITLVHRDPHPRNFLYPYNPETATVKLIDWQSWRVDTGTDDLAYLIACHCPIEPRDGIELNLLKHYYKRLVMRGIRHYAWEDCRYDYQASIIRCLFFLMVAWSPVQWEGGSWWDRVKRGIAAFERWACNEI